MKKKLLLFSRYLIFCLILGLLFPILAPPIRAQIGCPNEALENLCHKGTIIGSPDEYDCSNDLCKQCDSCKYPKGGGTGEPQDSNWQQKIHNPFLSTGLSSLTGVGFLQKFLNLAITLCLVVGGVIFFFMLLSGGIRWIASSGDKTQLEEARKQITHALIGMALLLSTFAIIQLIQSLFGVSLLNINLPTL